MYVSFKVILLIFLARHQVAATPDTSPGNGLDGNHKYSVKETGDSTELIVSAGDDETAGVTTCESTSTETGSCIK